MKLFLPLRFALIALWAMAVTGFTLAQASEPLSAQYPDKPLRLVVPYPKGGGADYWGQLIAKKLADRLGQPVTVDNMPGKGGNIGTAAVARAAADGYTLLLGSVGPLVVHRFTYIALDFNPQKDFVPIALLESSPILLVASPAMQGSSATKLIELARAKPGLLSYASNGNGSPEHVAAEIFKTRLKLEIRHLPYDGAGPARKAVLDGQASLMFDPTKGALPAIRKGLQTALAVAAPDRVPELPEVPTFGEIGLPQYELRIWTGIFAPQGTPREIVAKLNQAAQAILQTPEIQKEITDEGGVAGNTTPESFAAFLQAEGKHWSALVHESGISKVAQ